MEIIKKIAGQLSYDVAIDMGTSNISVMVKGTSIKFSEPSYVAYDIKKRASIAFGNEARQMLGRTPPNIKVVKPIRDGAVANFERASDFLEYLLRKLRHNGLLKPRVMVALPLNSSEIERLAVQEAIRVAGARSVYIIEQPVAAAVGADISVMDSYGGILVDFGAASVRFSLISLGGIVINKSLPIAGEAMNDAIAAMLRRKFNLLIGEISSENLKKELGSAAALQQIITAVVKGRDITSGLPRAVTVSSDDVREAISDSLNSAVEMIQGCIETAPHELISDIIDKGIVLSGGTAFLRGLDRMFSQALQLRCYIASDPNYSVVVGIEKIFRDRMFMQELFKNTKDRMSSVK